MVEIITLSRGKEQRVSTIEATFKYDGELIPLKVNEEDRPEVYAEINKLLEQPNLDIVGVSSELFSLMSPEAKVRQSIEDSYYLSNSLSIVGGKILFGDEVLEETLANHMLSLLNEDNSPKDEGMWRSYVKFLDNLFQNASEDVRKQLFRWMNYENQAGNAFGITDDGCLVGYKGCKGTVLEPYSSFTGNAIVDGVEINGHIPNKVGSVIQMPRSQVTADPEIGCSYGLHVGTRDYATGWAPILILVKVNPRDVVSVPYECESQKMRVCEYTVLKVTDATDEHKFYHSSGYDNGNEDNNNEDFILSLDEAYDELGNEIYVEYTGLSSRGVLVDVYEDGIPVLVIEENDGEQYNVGFDEITYYEFEDEFPSDEYEEVEMNVDEAVDLLSNEAKIFIERDDGNEYEGLVVDVYVKPGKEPGVILNNNGEYAHIKLNRIEYWEEIHSEEDECERNCDCEDYCKIDDRENIMSLDEAVDNFIKRLVNECGENCGCEENVCKYENSQSTKVETEKDNNTQFESLYELERGQTVVITHEKDGELAATVGNVLSVDKLSMELMLVKDSYENEPFKYEKVKFTDILSVQVVE